MSETAKALKINRTTLLRLLHTLEVEGFVEKRPSGAGYQIGPLVPGGGGARRFPRTSSRSRSRCRPGSRTGRAFPPISGCSTGATSHLVRRTPDTPLASNIRVGSRLPAHATSMGRMILAFMPAAELARLYASKELERFSDHTATTLATLRAKIEKDRLAGMAWSEAHFERGIGSAAVPVFDFPAPLRGHQRPPVGAFADAGRRVGDRQRVNGAAGAEISRRLGWVGPQTTAIAATKSLVTG